ncbi:CDK-activating kinase assembly factor MAT1-like isoform X2 [Gordionus sp. m RMFG-2023]|uniref:CDK-activating kinase assembly factor MAT1-like isoform X2 n=1 Tax=Gordionus sp. m RMFG-2023 TaxID=3053472 RepID=UPI0031FE1272
MDFDISCPRCKTSRYRNPSLKLLVNTCGHTLCESCVDLIFGTRASGHCPECHITLKRSQYHLQVFQDSSVEREVEIRKRLSKEVFNKTEEDFNSLKEFNNYLEFVEDIVFELLDSHQRTTDLLIETAKKKIEQYKKENKESILKNKGKLSQDQEFLRELIEEEKSQYSLINAAAINNPMGGDLTKSNSSHLIISDSSDNRSLKDPKPKNRTAEYNEKLLYELANSDLPADIIVKTHEMRFRNLGNNVDEGVTMDVHIEGGKELKDMILASHRTGNKTSSLLHSFPSMVDDEYIFAQRSSRYKFRQKRWLFGKIRVSQSFAGGVLWVILFASD